MIRNLPIIALTFFCNPQNAQTFLVNYGFTDVTSSSGIVDPTPAPNVVGLAFGSFTAVGGPSNPSASGRFSFSDWPLGGIDAVDSYSAYTGALSAMMYYEVSVAVLPGYTLSLNALSFAVRRSGTGIRNYCVRSSLDNFSNDLTAATGSSTKLSVIPTNVFFWNYDSVSTASDQKGSLINFGSAFSNLTGTTTLRFYAWNAETNGGNFSIDNVAISGAVKDSVSLVTSLQEVCSNSGVDRKLMCFPNPSCGGSVTVTSVEAFLNMELRDVNGHKLVAASYDALQYTGEVNVDGLAKGIYYLILSSDANRQVLKLILL
ncbi:MAG: T9SS type A sorting domain-containing protein [bacterium]|nr:T9SS type A sorting domain-containing protein [bacterium]